MSGNSRMNSSVRSRLGFHRPSGQQGGRRVNQSGWSKVTVCLVFYGVEIVE